MKFDDLFEQALNIENDEQRRSFLDRACGRDGSARARLDALLAAHQSPDSFLDAPPTDFSPAGTTLSTDRLVGTPIGKYQLVEKLAEGGMGLVYVAEQAEPVRRRVALKVIRPGLDCQQVIARFEAEQQTLAMMDHVNIARVFDAGTTRAGQPYFVMELVRGVTITQYCTSKHLGVNARLELFASVCAAVQHAHQKGIIHRDIKPSNILVEQQGQTPVVKVIDFGIAKAIDQRRCGSNVHTSNAQLLGTPRYMSPEQYGLTASAVDMRTDIYSLGVVLYELLTGTTPVDGDLCSEIDPDELCRRVQQDAIPPPSSRISRRKAQERSSRGRGQDRTFDARGEERIAFRSELDWVVMKALEREPARRYQSARDLAIDLENYQANRPLTAGPPSLAYRLRKYVRRHRVAAAAALCVNLLLVTLACSSYWVVAERSARRVEIQQLVERHLGVTDELVEQESWSEALQVVREAEGLVRGNTVPMNVTQQLERLRAELSLFKDLEKARFTCSLRGNDGFEYERADRIYREAFESYGVDLRQGEAVSLAEQLRAGLSIVEPVIVGLDGWASVKLELASYPIGASEEVRQAAKRQKELSDQLLSVATALDNHSMRCDLRDLLKGPGWVDAQTLDNLVSKMTARPQSLSTHILLADMLTRHQRAEDAIAVLESCYLEHADDFWVNYWLGYHHCDVNRGRPDAVHLHNAVRYLSVALASRPTDKMLLVRLGGCILRADQSRWEDAERYFQQALSLDPDCDYALWELAKLYKKRGKFAESLRVHQHLVKLGKRDAWWSMARVLFEQGKLDETHQAMDKYRALLGGKRAHQTSQGTVVHLLENTYRKWAFRLRDEGRFEEAIVMLEKGVEWVPDDASLLADQGMMMRRVNRDSDAEQVFLRAIDTAPKFGPAHDQLARVLSNAHDPDLRRPDAAIEHARRAIELTSGKNASAYAFETLGMAHYRAGNWQAAVDAIEKAGEVAGSVSISQGLFLAMAHWQLGDRDRARSYYEQASAEMRETGLEDNLVDRMHAEATALIETVPDRTSSHQTDPRSRAGPPAALLSR